VHLTNPHKARIALCCEQAVGEPLADNGPQHALEAYPVTDIAVIASMWPRVISPRMVILLELSAPHESQSLFCDSLPFSPND